MRMMNNFSLIFSELQIRLNGISAAERVPTEDDDYGEDGGDRDEREQLDKP